MPPRVISNLGRFRKPSPQIPIERLPMPTEGLLGQSIPIGTPTPKSKLEQTQPEAPRSPGKKSPHQMTVRTQIEVFHKTQPIKVAGYGIVQDNHHQQYKGKHRVFKMNALRNNQESNGRIIFGSKGASSTSLNADQRILYEMGHGATLTSQVSQQWATLPQTQMDDSLKNKNFRFDSRKNSFNLVQPSLSNQNSKIQIQHQLNQNQRLAENSETGERSPNNNLQGGSSSQIDQSAPFLIKTPKLVKKPIENSRNQLLNKGSNSLLEMISSKQKDLIQKERFIKDQITGASPTKQFFSNSKGSNLKTPRKDEASKRFSNRDLGNLLTKDFDNQNINFKHLDSGQIDVPQVQAQASTQSPKNSQSSPMKNSAVPKSKKRRGRQTGKEKEVLEILERYTSSLSPKPVEKRESKIAQNFTPSRAEIQKKRSTQSVEKVLTPLPVIEYNISPPNEKISQLNESQEGSSPQVSLKPSQVRKIDSTKIKAQAVNINSSEGSIEGPKVGSQSIHVPTGNSQINERESVGDISENQEQRMVSKQPSPSQSVQKKPSNEISKKFQNARSENQQKKPQSLKKISSKAHKLAIELQTQFEEQQLLMKQYELLNKIGKKDSNMHVIPSIMDNNFQTEFNQFNELKLKTKNSTQISDDVMVAKDVVDRLDILLTDASNKLIDAEKKALALNQKRTSQPKLRETMSLKKVMPQQENDQNTRNTPDLFNQTSRSAFIPSYTKQVYKGKKNKNAKMIKVASTAKKQLNQQSQQSENQFQSSKEFIIQVNVDAQQPPVTFGQRNSNYKYAGKRSPKDPQVQILNLQKAISKIAIESRNETMITQKGSPWSPSSYHSQNNLAEADLNSGVVRLDQLQKQMGSPRQLDGKNAGKMPTHFLIAEDAFRNKLMNKTSFASSFRDMLQAQTNMNQTVQISSKRKLSPTASSMAADLIVQGDNIKITQVTSKNSPVQSRPLSTQRPQANESSTEEKPDEQQSTSENDDISYASNQLSSPTGFKRFGKSVHKSSNPSSNKTNQHKSSSRLFRIAEQSDCQNSGTIQPIKRLDLQEKPSISDRVNVKTKPLAETKLNTIAAQHESEETTELIGSRTNSPIQGAKGSKVGERSPLQNQDLQLKLKQMSKHSRALPSREQSENADDQGRKKLSKNGSRHQIFKKHTPVINETQNSIEQREIKREVSKQFIEMKLPVNELKFRTQKNFLQEKNDNQDSQPTAKEQTAWSKQSLNLQILNQTKTSFLGTQNNEAQNTQAINDGKIIAGANTTRATSKFVPPAAISTVKQQDDQKQTGKLKERLQIQDQRNDNKKAPGQALQIQDQIDDNKQGNKTPSSLQKTPLSVTSPSRASVAQGRTKSTHPTPVRIELDEPGTAEPKNNQQQYKKVSYMKDVQVKYRIGNSNKQEIKQYSPTTKQFEALRYSKTPLSRQLENSPSAVHSTTLKQSEQQIIKIQTKGFSKANILKAAVTSIKTNRAQARQTIQIQLDQKILQSKYTKKKFGKSQEPNLPPLLNQAQQISLALSKANIEQSFTKQHQLVSDVVSQYYDTANEGEAGTQAPHFALSHGEEEDEHPTQQLIAGDLVSIDSRRQLVNAQRKKLFEQSKNEGEKIDAKGMAEIIDSRIQSFGETAGDRSDSAGWSFKANYTMDAKTLRIKPIDTAYRQSEISGQNTTKRKMGRNMNMAIVHVDENMISEERDAMLDYVAPLYEEGKTLESGDHISKRQNQKIKTIAVRQKNVILSRKSSSKSISIELEPRNLQTGAKQVALKHGDTTLYHNSISGPSSPGLRQHLRINAMHQTTDGFSLDQSKTKKQNLPNKYTKQSTMQEHNLKQIEVNALTPEAPVLPHLYPYQKSDKLGDTAYDQFLKHQQSVITPNIGNIRKIRKQRPSEGDETMTNMAVVNASQKRDSYQGSFIQSASLQTPAPNLNATFQQMREMYPGIHQLGSTILNDQVMFKNRNRSVFVPNSTQNSNMKQYQTHFPSLGQQQSPLNNSNVSFQHHQSGGKLEKTISQNLNKTFQTKRNTQKLFITRDQLQSIIRSNFGIGQTQKRARRSPSGPNAAKIMNGEDQQSHTRSKALEISRQRQQQNYSTQTVQQLLSINQSGQTTNFENKNRFSRKAYEGIGTIKNVIINCNTEETDQSKHDLPNGAGFRQEVSFDQRKQPFVAKKQGRTPVTFQPNALITKETTISPANERSDEVRGQSAQSPEPTIVFKPRLADNTLSNINYDTPNNEELPLTSIQLVYQQRQQQKVKPKVPFKKQSFVMTINPDREMADQFSSESGQRSHVNHSDLKIYQGEELKAKKRKSNDVNNPSGLTSGLKTRKNDKTKGLLNKDLVF